MPTPYPGSDAALTERLAPSGPHPRPRALSNSIVPRRDHPELVPGQLFSGRYRVERQLGAGSGGVVWLARDERLGRRVALKIASADRDGFDEALMTAEATALASVQHPNVVPIFDIDHIGASRELSRSYYTMEYLSGGDLRAWVHSMGGAPLALDAVVDVLGDVATGLEALHAAGLVHCDLKPSNVLRRGASEFVVADVASHRAVRAAHAARRFLGTPAYAAPERIAFHQLPDRLLGQGDVYSLAVMAYELITGRPPFEAESVEALLLMHLEAEPIPPSRMSPGLPVLLDVPLMKGLAKRPEERPTPTGLISGIAAAARLGATRAPRRVLVVDDDVDFTALLATTVGYVFPNAQILVRHRGDEALATHTSTPADLAIVDLQLPGLDGTSLVRALHRSNPQLPILVVSASGGGADWRRLRDAAFGFMLKPLDFSELTATLRRHFEVAPEAGPLGGHRVRLNTHRDPR